MTNQTPVSPRSGWQIFLNILTNSLLLLTGALSGSVLGILFVKLFVPRKAMGWDGIADALGGLMLGGLIGLVVSIVLIRMISVRHRLIAAAIECVLVLIVIAGVLLTQEPKPESVPTLPEHSGG